MWLSCVSTYIDFDKLDISMVSYTRNVNSICDIIVIMLSLSDRGLETWSSQTKDYKIGICCFSATHTSLRSKKKDWLARNQDKMLELSDISTCGHHHYLIKMQVVLVIIWLKNYSLGIKQQSVTQKKCLMFTI